MSSSCRRILLDGLDERRLGKLQVEERAEEVEELRHALVPERVRDGLAKGLLRRLRLGSLDDPEPRTEDPLHDAERRPAFARRRAIDADTPLSLVHPRRELVDEARLADARAPDDRDRLRLLLGQGARERFVELAHLGAAPDERCSLRVRHPRYRVGTGL